MTVLHLAQELVAIGNLNAISDAASSAHLAIAAARIAGLNVMTNRNSLKIPSMADQMVLDIENYRLQILQIEQEIAQSLRERANL